MRKRTRLLIGIAILTAGGCNLFDPDPFVPVDFNGLHEFETDDGQLNLRVIFEEGYAMKFVEEGAQKPVTNAIPVDQIEGRVNYVSYAGWMRPFPNRAVEQWNVSFNGNLNPQTGDYDGTLVLRLVTSNDEFGRYPASFRKVPE